MVAKISQVCFQNRYKELLRLSRQWRNLEHRKWSGWGHSDIPAASNSEIPTQNAVHEGRSDNFNSGNSSQNPDQLPDGNSTSSPGAPENEDEDKGPEGGAGSLAMFCATCPQPGVNIPENWKEDPNQ